MCFVLIMYQGEGAMSRDTLAFLTLRRKRPREEQFGVPYWDIQVLQHLFFKEQPNSRPQYQYQILRS